MTDQELQAWVESLSSSYFGRPFLHIARFNSRLRTTGGRYFLSDHRIEMNPKYLEAHGRDVFAKIILHELCHYHLHLQGKGYRHRDAEFRRLLKQVGGLRYAPQLTTATPKQKPPRYLLTCGQCGKTYQRKRKVDISRYVCGICSGSLQLEKLDLEQS